MRTTQQTYNAGIYCRLSVDDGTQSESMSIGNQRHMLTDHATRNGWRIADYYVDDGYSGVNFDRPDFQRLINDIEAGKINLVIVKDLSRLGRNYILCGQYTEIYFPERNVRFIALNDGIDTLYSNNDIAPFKNILNDMYAKDISVKIRSSLQAKAKRGEYLGACDPYGYLRDPKDKHHLVINPEVAPNVYRMFELCVSGYSLKKIADLFNREGILSPADYDDWRNHESEKGEFQSKYKWVGSVVRQVLKNPMFVGHMVQCRKRSQSYRTQKIVLNPREDWIIVENTHEPIVSQDLFDQVQKALEGRSKPIKSSGEPQIFSKLFFCAECGRTMAHHRRDNVYGNYFSCGKYRVEGAAGCSSHNILYEKLYKTVLDDIKHNIALFQADEDKALQRVIAIKCADEQKRLADAKKALTTAQKQQGEQDAKIKRVYEDNISGKLPDSLFTTFLASYEDEKAALQARVSALQGEIAQLESNKKDVSFFLKLIRQFANIEDLDRQALTALIDRITISEDDQQVNSRNKEQKITIYYKFVGAI